MEMDAMEDWFDFNGASSPDDNSSEQNTQPPSSMTLAQVTNSIDLTTRFDETDPFDHHGPLIATGTTTAVSNPVSGEHVLPQERDRCISPQGLTPSDSQASNQCVSTSQSPHSHTQLPDRYPAPPAITNAYNGVSGSEMAPQHPTPPVNTRPSQVDHQTCRQDPPATTSITYSQSGDAGTGNSTLLLDSPGPDTPITPGEAIDPALSLGHNQWWPQHTTAAAPINGQYGRHDGCDDGVNLNHQRLLPSQGQQGTLGQSAHPNNGAATRAGHQELRVGHGESYDRNATPPPPAFLPRFFPPDAPGPLDPTIAPAFDPRWPPVSSTGTGMHDPIYGDPMSHQYGNTQPHDGMFRKAHGPYYNQLSQGQGEHSTLINQEARMFGSSTAHATLVEPIKGRGRPPPARKPAQSHQAGKNGTRPSKGRPPKHQTARVLPNARADVNQTIEQDFNMLFSIPPPAPERWDPNIHSQLHARYWLKNRENERVHLLIPNDNPSIVNQNFPNLSHALFSALLRPFPPNPTSYFKPGEENMYLEWQEGAFQECQKLMDVDRHATAATAQAMRMMDEIVMLHGEGVPISILSTNSEDHGVQVLNGKKVQKGRLTTKLQYTIDATLDCAKRTERVISFIRVYKGLAREIIEGHCTDDFIVAPDRYVKKMIDECRANYHKRQRRGVMGNRQQGHLKVVTRAGDEVENETGENPVQEAVPNKVPTFEGEFSDVTEALEHDLMSQTKNDTEGVPLEVSKGAKRKALPGRDGEDFDMTQPKGSKRARGDAPYDVEYSRVAPTCLGASKRPEFEVPSLFQGNGEDYHTDNIEEEFWVQR